VSSLNSGSPLPTCVVCGGRTLTKAWLSHHHESFLFDCLTCGAYALESGLATHLEAVRHRGVASVLNLLPGLQRAIVAKRIAGEKVPYFPRDGWEAEAREHL
jgi:hypothetical protein